MPKTTASYSRPLSPRTVLLSLLLLLTVVLLAIPMFRGSAASERPNDIKHLKPVQSGLTVVSRRAEPARYSLFSPLPQSGPAAVTTFAGDCSTAKGTYNVQDSDKTVCAQISGALPGWVVIWSNARSVAVLTTEITSPNQTATFTLTPSSNLGDWRVIIYDPLGGTVQAVTPFTVIDAANPISDLVVNKGSVSAEAAASSQSLFVVSVTNSGPSDAVDVVLTDSVPVSTTFVSFAQLDGPVFNCTSPTAGNTGTTTCTVATLHKGETATFLATYLVDSGASVGTLITNTAHISSATADVVVPDVDNNTSTADTRVSSTPCILSCPTNITQDADAGQAGATVSYSTPSGSGDCGASGTGEDGEPIQSVSCSVPSGSFFPVGTTTVTCVAQSGDACSFQVSINNPGNLLITLNGPNTVALECGTDFEDPGATAVNANGEDVPVVITGNVNIHTPGSYTLTYTATEDPNSISTTRTVNVSDTAGPVITIEGSNPLTLSCGQPFTDPGVSANDACEGTRPVSSSGTVDSNTPGTYTITYTSSDTDNHTTTATRTVIVEAGGGTAPPTIHLIGDPQMTVECGSFTDPGATASVPCGGSVPVTVTGTVENTPGTYTLTYTACIESAPGVCDPARTSQVERTVTVQDTTAPTISLNGPNPLTVECHTSFTDPGATAHDGCAGDFAATASGTVDPNTVGQYTITYEATDPTGHSATPVTRTVNVVDTTPPTVTAPANVTVYTGTGNTSCTVLVTDGQLGAASATDSCAGPIAVSRSGVPSGNIFPVGETIITYSSTDASNNTGTATQTVTVIDNSAPTITLTGLSPTLWPANHRYQTFSVTDFVSAVSDNCTNLGVGDVVISQVTSDEAENGNGDGNTINDIVIAPDCKSVQVRAERSGGGNGRVYTITFRVRDASGNTTTATAKIKVPQNQGQTPVEDAVRYTVNGSCP